MAWFVTQMWNGIKPTHLWHLTGKKHFQNMMTARCTADPNRIYCQRKRSDLFTFLGLMVASGAAVGYAYGLFSPPNDCSKKKKENEEELVDPPKTCDVDPCPPAKPFKKPKPCPPKPGH